MVPRDDSAGTRKLLMHGWDPGDGLRFSDEHT